MVRGDCGAVWGLFCWKEWLLERRRYLIENLVIGSSFMV